MEGWNLVLYYTLEYLCCFAPLYSRPCKQLQKIHSSQWLISSLKFCRNLLLMQHVEYWIGGPLFPSHNKKGKLNTPGTRGDPSGRDRTLGVKLLHISSSYAKILGETNFQPRDYLQSGSKAKDGKERKKERKREKERNFVLTMACYACERHHGFCH